MNDDDFKNEKKFILETAKLNGYSKKTIESLYEKHKRKKEINELTSLEFLDPKEFKYISAPFFPPITNRLNRELEKFGYKIAYQNNGKLSDLLGTMKDKIKEEEKSGVYQINCTVCDAIYIGRTGRQFSIREKDHMADTRKPVDDEKPLAKHSIEENHPIGRIKMIKEVNKQFQLDTYESYHLYKNRDKNLLNIQREGSHPSILFKYA